MSTKDPDRHKRKTVHRTNPISHFDPQFNSINLNKNQSFFGVSPSKITSNKSERSFNGYDFPGSKSRSDTSWIKCDKDLKSFESSSIYDSEKEHQMQENKDEKSFINKSTLSLHIAAYENSIDADDIINESNVSLEKQTSRKNIFNKLQKSVKQYFSNNVSLFEIPRQRRNTLNSPEVMQFKSSQRLLNPNEVESSTKKVKGKVVIKQNYLITDLNDLLSNRTLVQIIP
uniref:Exophilin 5 n=1 Tax=Panagrolaimus sp. ES5 TaxID=591445 RepID=A0AC34F6Z3_9BILA